MSDSNLEITYEGKKYNDIQDPNILATMDGIKKYFDQSIESFSSEISEQDGHIVVNIPRDFIEGKGAKADITFYNMKEELADKITEALKK